MCQRHGIQDACETTGTSRREEPEVGVAIKIDMSDALSMMQGIRPDSRPGLIEQSPPKMIEIPFDPSEDVTASETFFMNLSAFFSSRTPLMILFSTQRDG